MQPLSLNLNKVDTSRPVLTPGKYPLQIKDATFVESKTKPGNWMLRVNYQTIDLATSTKGKSIEPGFMLSDNLMLPLPNTEYGEGKMADNYAIALTKWQLACEGLADNEANIATLPELSQDYLATVAAKVVIANVKTEADDTYGDSSRVKGVFANAAE